MVVRGPILLGILLEIYRESRIDKRTGQLLKSQRCKPKRHELVDDVPIRFAIRQNIGQLLAFLNTLLRS